MKQRTDKPVTNDAVHDKKPRFKIEKLEERIAPRCVKSRFSRFERYCDGHYNPHGKYVGAGKP